MSLFMEATLRPDPEDEARVRVWDLPIRLFHWSIVFLLCLSWFSADQGYMRVHLVSGVSVLALSS